MESVSTVFYHVFGEHLVRGGAPRDRPFRLTRHSHVLFLGSGMLLKKEVIQPQVLLQLPCYDFTPITNHTVNGCLP